MSRVAQILSALLLFISGTLVVFYMAQAQPEPGHLLHADDFFLDGSAPAATGNFSQPRMRSVSNIGSR
jgi:hypothetical protein